MHRGRHRRRGVVRTVLAWLAAAVTWAGAAGAVTPPNIVIFVADDQGGRDTSAYPESPVRTPHLARLAAEGMRFDRAFLTTSSCSPSRASLLTGRYPHATGAEDLHVPLPADQRTLAAYLGELGYFRAAIGKWHLGDAERRSWDAIVETDGARLGDRAVDVLEGRPRDRPLFLWVASTDPHRPYADGAIETPHDPASVDVPPYLPDHPKVRRDLALYYDEIGRFDAAVGRVLSTLEQQGIASDTLIVYLSDNGMPFPRAKTTLYDSGILTPMVVRWPGVVPAGAVHAGLVSAIDVTPTLVAAAGGRADAAQGRDLRDVLRDPEAPGRTAIFAEANWHDYEHFTRAVRTRDMKLIRHYYRDTPLWHPADSVTSITWEAFRELGIAGRLTPAQAWITRSTRPFEELYDVTRDPYELANIVDDPGYTDELWRLRTLLDNWRVETNDAMPRKRRPHGFTRDGRPLPHNQPFYDDWRRANPR